MSRSSLVTGGAGFLGSHLCERLLDRGETVYCFDNFSTGRRANIRPLLDDPNFHLLEGDIAASASPALPRVRHIYHLASRACPGDFETHPFAIADANIRGTRNVLRHARDCDARVLYTSTSEAYGDPQEHPQTEEYFGNVDPRGVRACYDVSKRAGEMFCANACRHHGVDARTVRVFNTYGPRMDDGRVVPSFLRRVLQGEPLEVHGDGEQTRSFCYVSDMMDGILAVMGAPDPAHRVYNIGSTREVTIRQLASTVQQVADKHLGVTYTERPAGDPEQRKPDTARVASEFGWSPDVGLKEGLSRTYQWLSRHH